MIKPNGLIANAIKANEVHDCLNCGGFVKIREGLYGCAPKDKILLYPEYLLKNCDLWRQVEQEADEC